MSDIEKFLVNVPAEGSQDPLGEGEQQEKETLSDSPTEKKQDETASSPDDDKKQEDDSKVPYHKNPRWLERERNWNAKLQSYEDKISSLEEKINSASAPKSTEEKLPERFVRLYGDNPEAWRLYREEQEDLLKRAKEEFRQEQAKEITQAEELKKSGETYVENSLAELHEEGLEFDDNAFMKFMVDLKEKFGMLPEDEDGNIDFRKGFQAWKEMELDKADKKKEKAQARRAIADFTTKSDHPAESETKDYYTSKDLRNQDWDQLIGR